MSSRSLGKYLRGHAQPEAAGISLSLAAGQQHVLCVPVYDESMDTFGLLDSLVDGAEVLVILIVNDRDDSSAAVADRNRALLAGLRERYGEGVAVGDRGSEHRTPFGGLLLLVRTVDNTPLPAREGVGLARKIACDTAVSLYSRGQLAADVIHCTDADARLPPDYFERNVRPIGGHVGGLFTAVFPFTHVGDDAELHQAGQLYEASLRYYVLGLQRAGSPYAMQTIGSTIAVSVEAYAAVRGFPRRHGAEDFYLLNKLAKVGPVERLGGAPIELRDRASDRIPFGTGPAVRRILDGEPRRFYDPRTFELLGDFLSGLVGLARQSRPSAGEANLAAALCPRLAPDVAEPLVQGTGIEGALAAAFAQGSDPPVRLRHLHGDFDAFRTLKWVHALRASGFEELPAAEAVAGLLGSDPANDPANDPNSERQSAFQRLESVEVVECRGPVGAPLFDRCDS